MTRNGAYIEITIPAKIAAAFALLCNVIVGVESVFNENKHESRGLKSPSTQTRHREDSENTNKAKTETISTDSQRKETNRCFMSEGNIFKTNCWKKVHNKHLAVNIQSGDTC